MRKDKAFYTAALSIAIPIALQNFITSSLNMVDTVLIGGLGPTAIAAVGLANQIFFLLNLVSFGICSGASIFTSQFWGERDVTNIRRVLGVSLVSNIAVGLFFFSVAYFIPGPVLRLFTSDPGVISQGVIFLRVIAFSYPLTVVSFAYAFTLRGVGQPVYPLVTSIVAFVANTILNFVLIYGHWGFPRLGVRGSATATLIARMVEVLLTLGLVYRLRLVPAARLRELFDLSTAFVRRFYRTTLPVICNESLWALGIIMYAFVYARLGTEVLAAYHIFGTVERLSMVAFFGLAQACAVMVGERIGAQREKTAYIYARRFALLGPALGVLIGGVVLLAAGPALSMFRVPPAVTALAGQFAKVFALTVPIRIFNLIVIVGVLRSGGDTKFGLFVDTFGLWFIGVPLAMIVGLVLGMPPVWVYLAATVEEVFKFSFSLWRLFSRKWINNLVSRMGAGGGSEADLQTPGV